MTQNNDPVLLFGATGNLGKEIAAELKRQGHSVTCVVRNESKARELKPVAAEIVVADATDPADLKNRCEGYRIVISALGKSVSPFERSKPSFCDVDLAANSAILDEAVRSGVKKFVYVSALHAERHTHLEYFRVHHEFSERLKQSGIDYSIIKPPALFSAFLDLMDLAKKGRLATVGRGDKVTNPIYEGDLAKICVHSIRQPFAEIEAGGKEVLSRRQINQIIQKVAAPGKTIRTVPLGLVKALLPAVRLFSKNTFDKAAFFTEVMQHDVLATKVGEMRLEEYLRMKAAKETAR